MEILHILDTISPSDARFVNRELRKRDSHGAGGIPVFFYTSGLFSSKRTCHSCDAPIYAKGTRDLSVIHLHLLEYIFSRIEERYCVDGKLGGSIRIRGINNFFSAINRRKTGDTPLRNILDDLHATRILIFKKGDLDAEPQFSTGFALFDHISLDRDTGEYQFSLTETTSSLFVLDDLLSFDAVSSLWGRGSLLSYAINYLACGERRSVPVRNLLSEMCVLSDEKEENRRIFDEVEQEILERKGSGRGSSGDSIKMILRGRYGIVAKADDSGALHLDGTSAKKKNIISKNTDAYHFVDNILSGNSVDAFIALHSPAENMNEYEIEKEVEKRLKKEIELWELRRATEYVDIHDADITQYPMLIQMATDAGLTVAEAGDVFADYCLWCQGNDVRHNRAQLVKTYKKFLDGYIYDKGNGGHKRSRKPIPEGEPNRGSAENITYTDEMKSILKSHNVDSHRWLDIFTDFKNHYVSTGKTLHDWKPRFDTWVRRSVAFESKRTSEEAMSNIEHNFYLARIVSEEVKNAIREAGHSPVDVLDGLVEIDDIQFRLVPVPPKFGKGGSEMLFSFKDEALNRKIIQYYSKRYKESGESQPNEEPIDVEAL